MNTMKNFLSTAALALVGAVMAGCSNDDNVQQSPNNDKVITLTTTLSLDNDDATNRAIAVDFGNKKATKTFAEGDMIVVFYKDANNLTRRVISNPLTAGNIHNDGKSADFTTTFMNTPGVNAQLRYVYPYFDAQPSIATDAEINDANTLCYDYIGDQFGLLSKNDYLDLATFDGNFSGTSLPASASLTNRLAILAFTLKNSDGSSAITSSILNMNISDGVNSYNVMSVDEDVIYAAIHPLTTPTALVITASDGTNDYEKTLTSRTYAAGNFYNMPVRMIPKVNLSSSSGDFNVTGDMIVTGTPAGNLNIKLPNKECTVTLDNVNPLGAHSVTIQSGNSNMTVKLKGTSKLESIQAYSAPALIIDEAAPGGTVIIESDNLTPLDNNNVIINGGTVMARNNDDGYEAVSGNLTVNGGAVYLAGGQYTSAVSGTISGSVTLYGRNGSQWDSSDTATQYVTSDNTSGDPASWTYWQ